MELEGFPEFLSKIIREIKKEETPLGDLYPAHEALRVIGKSRESVNALKKLLDLGDMDRDLRTVVLCRAAITALEDGLPLDLRPILDELGMRRKSASESLKYFKKRRSRREGSLALLEKNILSSMITKENSEIVESERMRKTLLLSSDTWIRESYEVVLRSRAKAEEKERDIWSYHLWRIKYLAGKVIFETGDAGEGIRLLRESLEGADKDGFGPLVIKDLLMLSSLVEDDQEGLKMAERAYRLADDIGNPIQKAKGLYLSGYRHCLIGEAEGKGDEMIKGAEDMLKGSNILSKEKEKVEKARYQTEASVWLIRSGEEDQAMQYLRKSSRSVKRDEDEELFIRIKCAYVFGLFKIGNRIKAKRSMMDLISHYPVKHYASCFNVLKEAIAGEDWLREDPQTAKLFQGEVVYKIEKDTLDEIINRAKEAYPNEFGAMLRGVEHITHIEPVLEGAGGRTSFVFSLFSRFSQRTVPGEGVVHSHPSGSARPSRADLSMFGRFPGINIIIAYPFNIDSMAAYDRLGNRVNLEVV